MFAAISCCSNWGVMVLEDVPQGAFLCTYNGLVCSDGTGDTRGIAFGDEYLMELDYIGRCVYIH